jgi:hypothetical protein
VLTAAYLLEVDGTPARDGAADATGADHAVARAILDRLHAREDMIEAVCGLIDRYAADHRDAALEQRVLRDAVLLADLEERKKDGRLDDEHLKNAVADCCTAACQQQADALVSR